MEDGATLRDHLEAVERQTGRTPRELDIDPLPPYLRHAWEWFVAIAAGRGSNGFGPNPISWLDIHAWASITRTAIRPGEAAAIMAMDRAWLAGSVPPAKK